MKSIKSQIIWFTIISLFITYSFGLVVWANGGLGSILGLLQMYIPALVTISIYIYLKKPIFKNGDLGLNFKGLKYWIIVPLFLTVLSLTTYGISYLFNPEMFETKLNIIEGLKSKGLYFGSILGGIAILILINGFIGSILNIPMFIGEELGWRGYLTPRLLKLFNAPKAFLLSAVVWALWHAVMIMQGLNYPSIHPVLGILLMIVLCIPLGVINQYFYFKSRSIIVAALAHAALNKSVMTASFLLKNESYDTVLYGPTGIIGIVIFSIVAIILYKRMDWKKNNTF